MLTNTSKQLSETLRPTTSSHTIHSLCSPLININNTPHRYHFPTCRAWTIPPVQPDLLTCDRNPSSRGSTFFLPAWSLIRVFWAFRLLLTLSPLPRMWMILLLILTSTSAREATRFSFS
ncbi:hypothetical protein SLEP1_g48267 [Rubroshorea leprosula]|uniref:Uncharacterized protein n=1 Tax=Rubroshorea leprosula TaxID=152421 RepID=A0AAV5LT50_9ROSI|nr:hypothetical protein SLEP1_g48267 [Rubroshorea leprosula]